MQSDPGFEPAPVLRVGNQLTSRVAVSLVQLTVSKPPAQNGLGFEFREFPEKTPGVDGVIEVVGTIAEPEAYTGRLVSVQIKGGPTALKSYGEDHWVYYASFAEFDYWRTFSLPILLLLVDETKSAIYWARVDNESHKYHDGSVAVHVPRSQVLNATSRDTIRQIAEEVPSTLSDLIEPAAVQLARQRIRQLIADSANSDRKQLTQARIILANTLKEYARVRDACSTMVEAVQDAWEGGDVETAASALATSLTWAVEGLRDPNLATALLIRAKTRPDGTLRPGAELWSQPLTSDTKARLDAARAVRAIFAGYVAEALSVLEAYKATRGEREPLEITRALALAALSQEIGETAAAAYEKVATRTSMPEEQRSSRIRAAWARAMLHGSQLDTSILNASLNSPLLAAESYRAVASTALNAGNLDSAAEAFVRSATESLRINDVPRAYRSLRNAARANFLAQRFRFDDNSPDARAEQLKPEAQRQSRERASVPELDDEARRSAGLGDLISVRRIGELLRIIGILDYDDVATQRGRSWLGHVWRLVAAERLDVESLAKAVRWTAEAGDMANSEIRNQLTALVKQAASRMTDFDWTKLATMIRPTIKGVLPTAQLLDSWLPLVPSAPASIVTAEITNPVSEALDRPWQMSSVIDLRRKACDLVVALDDRLPPDLSVTIHRQLRAIVSSPPPIHHEIAMRTASAAIYRAPPERSIANAIADVVIADLRVALDWQFRDLACLSVVISDHVSEVRRDALLDPLRAATRNGDLPMTALLFTAEPEAITEQIADGYLIRLGDILQRQLADVGGQRWEMGWHDIPLLTSRASELATENTRVSVGERALAFINESGHMRGERAAWFSFAAQLARTTSILRDQLWRTLSKAAVTGLEQDSRAPSLSTDSLSPVRVDIGERREIAQAAVHVLVGTVSWAPVGSLPTVIAALGDAATSPFAEVRIVVAKALGARSPTRVSADIASGLRADTLASEILRTLVRDTAEMVRLAAYESLDRSLD